MRKGSDRSREKRSSRAPGLLLCLAVAVPAAGLAWLGLSAYDAEESRELLRARRTLEAASRTLADAARNLLRDASLAADSWDYEAPPENPLLDGIFVVGSDGTVRYPHLQSFPAAPPPPAEDAERTRKLVAEAERILAESGDPWEAVSFLETAGSGIRHPDLAARLALREAELYLQAGRKDRARTLLSDLVKILPAARDEEGKAIAPYAHLRLLALDREEGRAEDVLEDARTLGLRLADRSFGLSPYERSLLLARVRVYAGGRLPPEVEKHRVFMDLVETLVVPNALPHLESAKPGVWRYLSRDGEVVGYRPLRLQEGLFVFGFRLGRAAFRERIEARAAKLERETGVAVELGTIPPPAARSGPDPRPNGPFLAGNLPGPFRFVPVRYRLPPPTGLSLLKLLHVAMVVLLAAALAAGVVLGIRAVRREVAAAKLKQDFTDGVSHELRTPLTSIRMYAEMLDEEELPEEKRREYLGRMRREAERLSVLVSEVLDFARLTRGDTPLEGQATAPAELVRRAVDLLRPAIREGGFSVEDRIDPSLPAVRCDPDSAVRALANLLSNALAYSGDARKIGVEAKAAEGRVRIGVRDHGPGVPPGERERIFTRYHRAPRDARRTRGVGLGLALAREIARAQGGDVTLQATGSDGSFFVLALPVAAEARS